MIPTGTRIRDARLRRGVSQRGLARKLHISPGTMSKYESGDLRVAADFLPKIAKVLGVEACELLPVEETEREEGGTVADIAARVLVESWDRLPEADRRLVDALVKARSLHNGTNR